MITTTELQSAVAGKLVIDANATDIARFKVLDGLNAGQLHLLNVLPAEMISEAVKTVKGNLSNAVSLYQWPSDFVRFLRLWVDYSASITFANLGRRTWVMKDSHRVSTSDSLPSTKWPEVELDVEGGFEIRPMPTQNVTDGWRLKYIQKLPDMSDSQNCMLNSRFKNLLVNFAVSYSGQIEGAAAGAAEQALKDFDKELAGFLPKREK